MACVAGSRQDSKRVHVHLMAHERTMATMASQALAALWAEWALTPVDYWAVGINGLISHGGEIWQHFSSNILSALPPLWISLLTNHQQFGRVGKSEFECKHLFTVLSGPFFEIISLERREFKPIIREWEAAVLANHPGNLNLGFWLSKAVRSKLEENSHKIDTHLVR